MLIRRAAATIAAIAGLTWTLGGAGAPVAAGPAQSSYLSDVVISMGTVKKYADESDNYHLTWHSDGKLYGAFGDGWGFVRTDITKRAIGISRITGTPPSLTAVDTWEGDPQGQSCCWLPWNGKSWGMISTGTKLHMWFTIGRPRAMGFIEARIATSSDSGKTWTKAGWAFTPQDKFLMPSFLQVGKAYSSSALPGEIMNYLYSYHTRYVTHPSHVQAPGKVDQGHVAHEHVEELRQLVEAGAAQEAADAGDARVLPGGLAHGGGVGRVAQGGVHGAELEHGDRLLREAVPALAVEDRPRGVEPDGEGHHQHQRGEHDQEKGGEQPVLDALEQPAPAVERALEQADHGHVADLVGAEHRHAAAGQGRHPGNVDAEMAQVAQGALEQVGGLGGQGEHDLVDLAGLRALLELGEAGEPGDAARPAAVERAVEVEGERDPRQRAAELGAAGGQAIDGAHELVAETDDREAARQGARDHLLAQGQPQGDAHGDQGYGTGKQPQADPQPGDVLGGLQRVEEGDHQPQGRGPADEQARNLPAEAEQPRAAIVAEPGQELGRQQAAERQCGQGGGRHRVGEPPPGDASAGAGDGQHVADPDQALDHGASAGGGEPAAAGGGQGGKLGVHQGAPPSRRMAPSVRRLMRPLPC